MSDRILTPDEMNRLFAALIQNETRNLIAGGALALAARAGLFPAGDDEPFENGAGEVSDREPAPAQLGPGQPAQRPENPPAGHLPEKRKPGRPKNPPAPAGHLPAPPGYPPPQLGPAPHGGPQAGGPRPGGHPQ